MCIRDRFREVYDSISFCHILDNVDNMNAMLNIILSEAESKLNQSLIIEHGKKCITDFTIPKFADRWGRMIEEAR